MNDRLTLRVERDVSALGAEWDPLFAGGGLQASRAWIEATIAAAMPDGAEPALLALSDADGPVALLPMQSGPGRRWRSLTTPYTCLYQPLLRFEPAPSRDALRQIGHYCRQWPITRLEALDPDWPGLVSVRGALADAGLATRTFENFGNWHETVIPGSWDGYLASRPGALRETIRRRTRAATRSGVVLRIARAEPDLSAALDAYETVYRKSWKEPEPYPMFNTALVRALAQAGVLRIGVMWKDAHPIAAQYWSVVDRAATVLKLAHDEDFKAFSPGTVLTAATIRELIETDGIHELDFGRGDDPYKRNWASQRRWRIGLLGLNVRTVTGLQALVEHDAGGLFRKARTAWRATRPKMSTKLKIET